MGLEYQQSCHCWTVGDGLSEREGEREGGLLVTGYPRGRGRGRGVQSELNQFGICGRSFGLHFGLDLMGNWGLADAIFGNFSHANVSLFQRKGKMSS